MKTPIPNLHTIAAFAATIALPWLSSAATKEFTLTMGPPASQIVVQGTAASTPFNEKVQATGNFSGWVVLTVLSNSGAAYGVTATITPATTINFTGNSSSNLTVTVGNAAATPAGSYYIYIWGTTTNAVTGTANKTNTATLIVSAGGSSVWAPTGANTNWSVGGNWSPAGPPALNNDVKFFDVGAVSPPGTINNVVDASSTISSLTFGQTNNSHTTLIPSGVTLAISSSNPVDPLSAGTGADNGSGQVTVNTIKGAGGALTVSDTSANVNVGQAAFVDQPGFSSAQATLDLSALDTFTATVAHLYVGSDASAPSKAGSSGVLNLAKTNRITTASADPGRPQIDIGDNTQANGTEAVASTLALGQTNAIFADSIAVGRGKGRPVGSTLVFNSLFSSPVAYLRGTGGASSRISSWWIADGNSAKASICNGTCDFSLGTVNALVDTMYVGEGSQASPGTTYGTGTLTLGAGTIDVNTLKVGYNGAYSSGNTTFINTGTGTVNVNSGGTLVVNTSVELAHGDSSAAGTLNIAGGTVTANNGIVAGGGTATISMTGGALNVANSGATIGTALSPITSLSVSNSTLAVAAGGAGPAATVGTLTAAGTANTINISAIPLISSYPARFQLIAYSSSGGGLSTLVRGTLPAASPSYAGSVEDTGSSIDLVLTGGPVFYPLIWSGTPSGNWNTDATQNWKSNGIAAPYLQNYAQVQFDDSLTGTSTVNLMTALTPGSILVNNTAEDYTFGGSGKISSSASLTKSGSRTLILAETGGNDFTGGVTVSGGTLQVGNGSAAGSLGAGPVSLGTGTSLVFGRSGDVIIPNVISGSGTITQNGTGVVTLGGTNTSFAGEIVVAQGTLAAGSPAALGTTTGGTTTASGATLDVNGQKFNNTEQITVSGVGVGGKGAIVNNSTNSPNQILRNVTLAGPTTFGGYSDWDIHSSLNSASDASLSTGGNPYKLTKVGTNTVSIFGALVDDALPDIDIQAGTLSFERNTTGVSDTSHGLGNPANTVTVFTNATLQLANASNVWNKVVLLKDGATLRGVNGAEFEGPVTLESGIATIMTGSGALLTLDAAIDGAGGLTKNGSGTNVLLGVNTYPGNTLINAGKFVLGASGSINNSSNITVVGGATLDVSGRSDQTLTLTSVQSLKGSGAVWGSVTAGTGSTLSPGGPGTNTVGTLTITSNLVLQANSTTIMELNKAANTNDQVAGLLSVTYGGTLTVKGVGGAYAAGDVFKLFAAGTYNPTPFATINVPVNAAWDTTQLTVDGTIRVLSVNPPTLQHPVPGAGGTFSLSFTGPAGNNYQVWMATNLSAVPVIWTSVATGLFGDTGNGTYLDTTATNSPARFYRISVP